MRPIFLRHKAHRLFLVFAGDDDVEESSKEGLPTSSALWGENEVRVMAGLVADGIAIGSELDVAFESKVSGTLVFLVGVASLVSKDAMADSTELFDTGTEVSDGELSIWSRLLATGEIAGDILPLLFFFCRVLL